MAKKQTAQKEMETVEQAETVAAEAPVKAEKKATKKKAVVKADVDVKNVDAKGVQQMRDEYFQHRLNVMLGKENDTAKLQKMRKNIARAQMYLNMNKQK